MFVVFLAVGSGCGHASAKPAEYEAQLCNRGPVARNDFTDFLAGNREYHQEHGLQI